ncbi:hypothetical protein NQ315_008335 [Exocentrus adspersus]|uniref:Uncharacterized protein n=1 Tax=Exocentrus adspersus TaxID=1586481 RepID=A0AAV8VAU2_9CUCU|nr:hypothetical protein NQ315_008335 [Exocentrus adspersus]
MSELATNGYSSDDFEEVEIAVPWGHITGRTLTALKVVILLHRHPLGNPKHCQSPRFLEANHRLVVFCIITFCT